MKTLGWILIALTAIIVFRNVSIAAENRRQLREHPVASFLTAGRNMRPHEDFEPPYSKTEVITFVMFIAGVVLVVLPGPAKDQE